MAIKSLILGLGFAAVASAGPVNNVFNERAACNADYCLRAIRASQIPTRLAQATVDCSTFVGVTVYPSTITVTSTVNTAAANTQYTTVPGTYTQPDIFSGINTIPPYASTCTQSSRFSSACSCIGVTAYTTNAPTPTVTTTETDPAAATVTVTVQSPTLRLPSPTAILTNGRFDDTGRNFTLPFPVKFYNKNYNSVEISVNGLLGFSGADYSLSDTPLPSQSHAYVALAALWDDFIINGPGEGIYYQVTGATGARALFIEYNVHRYDTASRYRHFLIRYEEAVPNIITIQYYEIEGTGSGATIAQQNYPMGFTYSSDQAGAVPYGTILKFDTVANTITQL